MTRRVVGVDSGGSRTRAVVMDDQGLELGRAEGPASALQPGKAERSAAVIAGVVHDALDVLDNDLVAPRSLCAGVAGAGRARDREALERALAEHDLAAEVLVTTDAEIALADAFGDGPGILLIAGTGSIAFGRGPTGMFTRCGGWGHVCGDEGSGFWIGRRALSVATAGLDGREPETSLSGAILTMTELSEPEDLITWASIATPVQIAALATVVAGAAERGDLRAGSILDLAAEELVLHVRTLARSLFQEERAACEVALSGGLLPPGATLRKRVEHRMASAVPGARVLPSEIRPERGAARMAMRAATSRDSRPGPPR